MTGGEYTSDDLRSCVAAPLSTTVSRLGTVVYSIWLVIVVTYPVNCTSLLVIVVTCLINCTSLPVIFIVHRFLSSVLLMLA